MDDSTNGTNHETATVDRSFENAEVMEDSMARQLLDSSSRKLLSECENLPTSIAELEEKDGVNAVPRSFPTVLRTPKDILLFLSSEAPSPSAGVSAGITEAAEGLLSVIDDEIQGGGLSDMKAPTATVSSSTVVTPPTDADSNVEDDDDDDDERSCVSETGGELAGFLLRFDFNVSDHGSVYSDGDCDDYDDEDDGILSLREEIERLQILEDEINLVLTTSIPKEESSQVRHDSGSSEGIEEDSNVKDQKRAAALSGKKIALIQRLRELTLKATKRRKGGNIRRLRHRQWHRPTAEEMRNGECGTKVLECRKRQKKVQEWKRGMELRPSRIPSAGVASFLLRGSPAGIVPPPPPRETSTHAPRVQYEF